MQILCLFLSLTHTHTQTCGACCWVTWQVHHAHCSPEASYHLLKTSFGLCSVDDPSQLQMTREERREELRMCEKEDCVRDEMRPWLLLSPSGMCLCSLTISSAFIHFSGTSCLLFLEVFNNLLYGLLLVWPGRGETIHLPCHGFESSSCCACPLSTKVQVTVFVSRPILKPPKADIWWSGG